MLTINISIVVLNWNGWRDTICCLESLLALTFTPSPHIIVCDNNSSDDSLAQLEGWATSGLREINQRRSAVGRTIYDFSVGSTGTKNTTTPSLVILKNSKNLGYAGGNNVGILYALDQLLSDYVWILNNDVVVTEDSLNHLILRMSTDSDVGLCGSTVLYHDEPRVIQTRGGGKYSRLLGRSFQIGHRQLFDSPFDRASIENELTFINGAAVLLRRNFIETIGLMSEIYFLYYEEADWGERGRARFKFGYAPESIVYHKVGKSIGTRDVGLRSELSEYYLRRNRIVFSITYSPLSLPMIILDICKSVLGLVARGHFNRAALVLRASVAGFSRHSKLKTGSLGLDHYTK